MGKVVTALAIVFAAVAVHAQGLTATLVGTIVDTGRAPLAGASVTISNRDNGLTRIVRSAGDGAFTATTLPPGRYDVTVAADGFKSYIASEILLGTSEVRRVDVRLELAAIEEHVTVHATVAAINTETAARTEVVPNALVDSLPLNGRDYVDLALLAPGMYRRVADDQGDGAVANGTRWDATGFALDGVVNRSDRGGNSAVQIPLDAVREFGVQTSSYAAEYGRSAGAQINVVSKSGLNTLTGSVSDYFRSDRFDARNEFAPPGEPTTLQRHQGGGAAGGPIVRNRTFFFGAYERTRERQSEATNSTAPNAAWLTGDFRNVRGAGSDGIWGTADDTNRILNPFTRQEFATPNVIPSAMIDPIARQILPFVPAANMAGTLDGYAAQGLAADDRQQWLVKIDHATGPTTMSGRWARSVDSTTDPFPTQRVFYPAFGRDTTDRADSFVLSATSVLSGRAVNDARVGYMREAVASAGHQSDTNYVGQFGLTGLSQDRGVWGFPTIRIDGFPDFGDRPNDPSTWAVANLQLRDTVSWTPEDHAFKAGFDLIRSTYDELDLRGIRGDFRFRGRGTNPATGASTGFRSFADFLLGVADQTQRQVGEQPARLRGFQIALFAQDEWRVRPSLTLSAGLRYERQSPLTEASNRLANFIPSLASVVLAGDNRFPASLLAADNLNLGPRVGFAWRPSDDLRTSVRGGAGIYYSLEAFNVARQQLAVSYPFVLREQYARTSDAASLTFSNPFPAGRGATQGITQPLGMAVDYRPPRITEYNVTIERELALNLALEVGYVGSQGRHLGRRYNLNQPIPIGLAADGSVATVRPYPQFADIQYEDQAGASRYDAVQAVLRRRMRDGLTTSVSYTFGKSIDTGSTSTGNLSNVSTTGAQKAPQDIYNMNAERGLSDFDRRHELAAAFAYDLPFAGPIAGGWQVSGIVTLLSGRPFTPQYAAGDFATQRPNLVGDPAAGVPAGLWFNPAAFARPVATTASPNLYGNAGRNILTGPDYQDVDLALAKTLGGRGRTRAQLRIEAFNLFNRPNLQIPVFLLDQSNAGRVTSTAGDARQLQLAVRVLF